MIAENSSGGIFSEVKRHECEIKNVNPQLEKFFLNSTELTSFASFNTFPSFSNVLVN